MVTSMTARVSTNRYCKARTWRFSRRPKNSVGRAKSVSQYTSRRVASSRIEEVVSEATRWVGFFLIPARRVGNGLR